MKKLLLLTISALVSLPSFADLGGDGYYRVQNAHTKRYAYLLDDKGKIDTVSTSADVGAIELYLGFSKACSDPSTIFYIDRAENAGSGSYYDIAAQGTSIHGVIGEYLKIIKGKVLDGEQAYYAYASKSGGTKYLGDLRKDMTAEKGLTTVEATGDARLWYIDPVDASSDDSYFGILPTIEADGKYYYPLFAGFPYTAYSKGVKFYYVFYVDYSNAIAVVKEVKGTVPSGKAVIVECESPLPSDNRLNIGVDGALADLSDSMLKGVYFDNDTKTTNHYNRTPYDKRTMRTLKVKDGKLSLGVGEEEFLPRNQAYLQLTWSGEYNVEDYTIMTVEEYDQMFGSVSSIEESMLVDVYSLDGRMLKSGIAKEDVGSLGKGLYILKGKGVSEKMIVR